MRVLLLFAGDVPGPVCRQATESVDDFVSPADGVVRTSGTWGSLCAEIRTMHGGRAARIPSFPAHLTQASIENQRCGPHHFLIGMDYVERHGPRAARQQRQGFQAAALEIAGDDVAR